MHTTTTAPMCKRVGPCEWADWVKYVVRPQHALNKSYSHTRGHANFHAQTHTCTHGHLYMPSNVHNLATHSQDDMYFKLTHMPPYPPRLHIPTLLSLSHTHKHTHTHRTYFVEREKTRRTKQSRWPPGKICWIVGSWWRLQTSSTT